ADLRCLDVSANRHRSSLVPGAALGWIDQHLPWARAPVLDLCDAAHDLAPGGILSPASQRARRSRLDGRCEPLSGVRSHRVDAVRAWASHDRDPHVPLQLERVSVRALVYSRTRAA